ncbi:FAD-dependent oxidoreductase [Paraburkholderia sp. LEh10]|uniref:oxidoreductase n=1 Tax=Paraburkholderia sp. LEh10 TaxID=2821353 RepID=UPI001AE56B07|nr:FAD-dependent oxidoreductase [Paraburkholderia sp. LEh10]MBP0588358.1 FAD-dependent oxidoreductase [Paraburkholderia sp. LEh10]
MSANQFPKLFSPLKIRGSTLKNRIMSTGHDTTMPTDGRVNDALVAYHEARARGGAGLIVMQVAGVHETARYTSHLLMATDDDCIPGYRRLADAVHAHGCRLFTQLFHPGRELMESADGLLAVAYAPSSTPNERFHVMPRALTREMIAEIVHGYGQAARRMYEADLDGVEFVASHGYLPSQCLNPLVNRRTDEYGGNLANRLRFLREVLAEMRRQTSDSFVIGMRISAGEREATGLTADDALEACTQLEPMLDYVNITAGTSASLGGAIHIVPPMAISNAYVAADSKVFKQRLGIPVFVGGRINQPHEAESVIVNGQADVCGMTRALICDPSMPAKAEAGRTDDIRACIACNQACIGHFHRGYPISCIQHPETGRELTYGEMQPARRRRKVMVVGGGPAGMKAAATAARRGHDVTLYEAGNQLGGQALLAQLLPRRNEFGGIVTNLGRELELSGARVLRNARVDESLVKSEQPDVIILATGAKPYVPDFEHDGGVQVVTGWQVLRGEVTVGRRVLVVDWRCDWIGPGIAEMLTRAGSEVQLAVNGTHAGETLPLYVRDNIAAELHRQQIAVTPYARLYGCDGDSVFMQHTTSDEAIVFENIDTLVLCHGHQPDSVLEDALRTWINGQREASPVELIAIGDCMAPRTAEEAVYEGLKAGWQI